VTVAMTTTAQETKTVEERLADLETGSKHTHELVLEIHGFCMRLAETLDALGSNPMVAAMVPPGTFGGGTDA